MSEKPTQAPSDLPIRLVPTTADLPPGVAAIVLSPPQPDEMLPGESMVAAITRLRRAVVIRE